MCREWRQTRDLQPVFALVDEGDDVIIPTPYWVSFGDIAHYASEPDDFRSDTEEEGFRLTAKMLEERSLQRRGCSSSIRRTTRAVL
jgi:aspartate/methionine/tyrosine aminotransferase